MEKQVVICIIMFNTIYFGWVLSSIAAILGQYEEKEKENTKYIKKLNSYMKSN